MVEQVAEEDGPGQTLRTRRYCRRREGVLNMRWV
jgi:hypothetical protein